MPTTTERAASRHWRGTEFGCGLLLGGGPRHLAFLVDDVDRVLAGLRRCGAELVGDVLRYGDTYRLCYVRGPAGIIIELAEEVGAGAAG